MSKAPEDTPAVLLAASGTAAPEGLPALFRVRDRIAAAFPGRPLQLCFTARGVRAVWRKRSQDRAWLAAHPGIPAEVLPVAGPLLALAEMSEAGFRQVVVQPLHLAAGEDYLDLRSLVAALGGLETVKDRNRLFDRLVLGRPALGAPGHRHPRALDLNRAAAALAPEVEAAGSQGQALVWVGHGHRNFSTGVYAELEAVLRRRHPEVPIFIGLLEGFPGQEEVIAALGRAGAGRVLLLPLLLTAGRHARRDICGPEPGSWQTALRRAGLEVDCRLAALGDSPAWVDIYVHHLGEALEELD